MSFARTLFLCAFLATVSAPAWGMSTALSWARTAVKKIQGVMNPPSAVQQIALSRAVTNLGVTPVLRGVHYFDVVDKAWHDHATLHNQKIKAFTDFSLLTKKSKKKKVAKRITKKISTKKKKKKQTVRVPAKARVALLSKTLAALTVIHQKKLMKESVFQKAKRVALALVKSLTLDHVSDYIGDPLRDRTVGKIVQTFGATYGWRAALAFGSGALLKKVAQACALEAAAIAIDGTSGFFSHLLVGVGADAASSLGGLAKSALGW